MVAELGAVIDVTPEVAVEEVDQPLNILLPFVNEHVELLQEGKEQDEPTVQVTLPEVVLDAPPHVPLPPFLFSVIVTVLDLGQTLPPEQV